MKKVLILGAGLVAKPMVDYLLSSTEIEVTVASRTVSKAEKLVQGKKQGSAVQLLVDDDSHLENLIRGNDICVSLLPYTYHVKVAKLCLKHGKPLVTTSYVSDAMKALDNRAREQNLLLLNEIGLDPGIDHMSAMRIIHDVKRRGGEIESFRSYCGGLPAPGSTDPCCKYKFSWSPRGVLMAGRNNARFLENDKIVDISGNDLFKYHWQIKIDELNLETYPNRDSLPYIELYGIPETKTMYRGTLRYPGWSRTMYAISKLGFLEEDQITGTRGLTFREVTARIVGCARAEEVPQHIAVRLKIDLADEILRRMEWLGLFSDQKIDAESTTPLDFLAAQMLKKLQYRPSERDMIILYHDFIAKFPDHTEHITSTLIDFGQPEGDSSMSRTVSLPAAIAVKLILQGKISETGVRIPVTPEIYNPVLDELERLHIVFKENVEIVKRNQVEGPLI